MRPIVSASTRLVPIGRDLSAPAGKSWLYRLAASECTSALKTLMRYHPHPNETPHYILAMHAIELGLKAFLIKSGMDDKTLRSKRYRHDLCSLYQKAVADGLTLADPNSSGLIAWANEWHDGARIRYEFSKERDLPMCSELVTLADAIIAASE